MALDIVIATDWRGRSLPDTEHVSLRLHHHHGELVVDLSAPFHGDPPPPTPVGPTWGLWEHEVVELFICGPDDHYVELELSPHGHHLFLRLRGIRAVAERDLAVVFDAVRTGDRWTGRARFDARLLPPAPHRLNATAIHGLAPRRHLSWRPLPGRSPDFHQPAAFAPVVLRPSPSAGPASRPTDEPG